MKIICAPGAFKGSLSAFQAAEQISKAFRAEFPQGQIVSRPLADGGEGTKDILQHCRQSNRIQAATTDALGRDIIAEYIVLDKYTAVIEAAAAIGFSRLDNAELNPYNTSSWGLGQLLRHAVSQGYRRIYIALGDCATNDGGLGAIAALGGRFLDINGNELAPIGRSLGQIHSVDTRRLLNCCNAHITVLCDINAPLLGAEGTTMLHGADKGASQRQKEILEAGMENYCSKLEQLCGYPVSDLAWAGAGGGIAVALLVFLQAELRSGIDVIFELSGFPYILDAADFLITGAEELAGPYSQGKLIPGLCLLCKEKKIPLIALVGTLRAGEDTYFQEDLSALIPVTAGILPEKDAIGDPSDLLYYTAAQTARLLHLGMTHRL